MRARVQLTCLVPHGRTAVGLEVVRARLEDGAGVGRIGERVREGVDHRPQKMASEEEEGEEDNARDMSVRTGKYTNATPAPRAARVVR